MMNECRLNARQAALAADCLCWRSVQLPHAGGAVVRYTAPEGARLSLMLDACDAAPAAQLDLPACRETNAQLFAWPAILDGVHDVYLRVSGTAAAVDEVCLHPAKQIVVGSNPVICADMPDPDVIRVGDTYYMASTTMHNMPGGTLLRSYDLIHWEIAAYLYEQLPLTGPRCLQGGNAYGKGMWAPTLRWHNGVFHVCFSANDTHCTYHYWAADFEGPWQMQVMRDFYYDCSLFFDDDGRAYMVHGHRTVRITELDAALTGAKAGGLDRVLIDYDMVYPGSRMLGFEGSHLYRHKGRYYLFSIHSNPDEWFREESCFTAASLTEPFVGGVVLHSDMGYHHRGVAQGGMVDTPDGRWYAFMFQDRGASGRMPVLMPMRWENGMPVLGSGGCVEPTVCSLTTRPGYVYAPIACDDDFAADTLGAAWQWNHTPERSLVRVGGGQLRITTGGVCSALTDVRNVLTQRALSPVCVAEVTVQGDALQTGDLAGLCAFQSCFAAIGLRRTDSGYAVEVLTRSSDDAPEGTVQCSLPWPHAGAAFRLVMDFADQRDQASLYVQQNGAWRLLHSGHAMRFTLDHFTGNKAALFAMATRTAGGTACFRQFRLMGCESAPM